VNSALPITGTNALLEQLSPFIPDAFLREQWPHTGTGGRQGHFSAAQLWRVHLLVLLTPAHSINLLVQMLPEQRAWRQFAHLPNRHRIPDVRMLHEFRRRLGVAGLRRVNEVLLAPLLEALSPGLPAIALMDATDLPAADRGFKKIHRTVRSRSRRSGWANAQDGAKSLLCRVQETYVSIMAVGTHRTGAVGAAGQLDGTSQRWGRRAVGAGVEIVRSALELAAGLRRRRHGLLGRGEQAGLPTTLASGGGDASALGHERGATI
jgi:hypothetical protein